MKSTNKAGLITVLILRLLVLIFLLVSITVLTTDAFIFFHSDGATGKIKLPFRDTYAYRYVLSVAVTGCVHTLLQVPFEILNAIKVKNLGRDHTTRILIFSDLVFSLLFAAGVGAGFGETVECKTWFDRSNDPDKRDLDQFYDIVHIATGFLLMATGGTAFITLISINAFAKK